MRALTREIDDRSSPARQFLDQRFAPGFKEVQRRFRLTAPPLAVPPVPLSEANPGTVGSAADWLLRFMVYPTPAVDLAFAGASSLGPRMMKAITDVAARLQISTGPYDEPVRIGGPSDFDSGAALTEIGQLLAPVGTAAFTGPARGSAVDADLLARGCWALALATELLRSGQARETGPLARFGFSPVTADDLLALAPPAGLDQLARFRLVFESELLPRLAARPGKWVVGPTFAGSALIGGADGDLIAAGLLLDLKTSAKLTLTIKDLWQLIGYALLDYDDEYHLESVGIFSVSAITKLSGEGRAAIT